VPFVFFVLFVSTGTTVGNTATVLVAIRPVAGPREFFAVLKVFL
jgi:hypothetical protein